MDTLFLSVKDMSAKLNVSEKTVYRMINDNKIPYGIKIGGQWRFNSEKIDKWVNSGSTSDESTPSVKDITIGETLDYGSVIYKLCGTNRDETLDQILSILSRFTPEEKQNIKKNILYKESIISSSVSGVSVMIADYDQQINSGKSVFAVAYLDTPLDFKAIDGIATEIVILIIPANTTEQLVLSTRLRGLMHNDKFVQILRSEPTRSALIEYVKDLESKLFSK
jgi:PTS system nitrogen regulatory IIA component